MRSPWQLPIATNPSYLSAFIAPAWQKLAIAYPLFSTIVFLQCMHYAAVIGLLSQWTNTNSLNADYRYPRLERGKSGKRGERGENPLSICSSIFEKWTNVRSASWRSWLSDRYFYLIIGGVSIAFFIAFQHSFAATRAYYSIVASIHAWIEIPLLLLLLQPRQQDADRIGEQISTEG